MANLNKVMVIGNVGKDPEVKYTQSGKKLVSFSLAVNSSFKTANGEKKTDTEWINLEAWGKLADVIHEYVTKGSSVYVEGRLKTDKFDDKNGDTKYFTKVVVSGVQFLGGKNDGATKTSNVQVEATSEDSDEIPF